MNKSSLNLTVEDISNLSVSAQNELRQLFFPKSGSSGLDASGGGEGGFNDEDGPADLTIALCRKLIAAPIHEKSLAVLRVIAESNNPEFKLADAIFAAPGAEEPNDLRGVWSGLTRRTRKILDDDSVDLVWWEGDPIYDDEDNYIDQVGRVSSLTHQSLRVAMGIR